MEYRMTVMIEGERFASSCKEGINVTQVNMSSWEAFAQDAPFSAWNEKVN